MPEQNAEAALLTSVLVPVPAYRSRSKIRHLARPQRAEGYAWIVGVDALCGVGVEAGRLGTFREGRVVSREHMGFPGNCPRCLALAEAGEQRG